MLFDQKTIQDYIPHRPPLLLLDNILSCEKHKSAAASLLLKKDDWYFNGHFPKNPIFPGVLSVELMAQTAAFLMAYSLNDPQKITPVYLLTIEKSKFLTPAIPGDLLTSYVDLLRCKEQFSKFKGVIQRDKVIVCEAEFMAMRL